MNHKATEQLPRIVVEAEKIVHDSWLAMGRYERWKLKATAETLQRRRQQVAAQ